METSLFKLKEKTAVLTGPMTRTQQAIAVKLTEAGADVAILDRNIERTNRIVEHLMENRQVHPGYGRAAAITADLTKPHHVEEAIVKAAETFGGIDIYIDGLMISHHQNFRDTKLTDQIDRMVDVNLKSALLVTHQILKFLEGRRRGRIIYLVDDNSRAGCVGTALNAVTRNGFVFFAKALAREEASRNITINCVSTGLTEEFLLERYPASQSIQNSKQEFLKDFPGAQIVDPEKVANFVAFLASPLGSGLTGQVLSVNDGLAFS